MSDEDAAPAPVPLWRQFYEEQKRKNRAADGTQEKNVERDKIQQDMLRHVISTREAQGLPPFFAIITGPTIQKYFMEELCVTLGRVTTNHKVAFKLHTFL